MAILNLGTRSPQVGATPVQFDPLIYNEKDAYIIYMTMTIANIDSVYSYVQIKPLISPTNEPSFYLAPYLDFEIRQERQSFYLPCSSLWSGNGTCVFELERIPFVAGFGDTISVDINLFYDNAVSVRSWRN